MRDPYKILGVARDAGADEIKTAWRNLAKAVHPDHNQQDPTANARFAEIGRAYDTLKDPRKRSRYDQLSRMAETKSDGPTIMQERQAAREAAERAKAARANAERVMEELARAQAQKAAAAVDGAKAARSAAPKAEAAGQARPEQPDPAPAGTGRAKASAESAEEMIERIFGARVPEPEARTAATAASAARQQEAAKPETEEAEQAFVESEPALAAAGGGIGAFIGRPSLSLLSSLVRRFTGAVPAPDKTPDKPLDKAPDIAAEATVSFEDIRKGQWIAVTLSDGREVRFQATPGIRNGQVVRLKAQGLKLQGMQRGDVAITVHIEDEGRFVIKGLDVHTVLPVTIEDAVLGSTASIEAPNGSATVTIPAWSGSDQVIRVAGAGLADAAGARGDLVVELRLMLWEKPDDKVTDLMRSMKNGLYL